MLIGLSGKAESGKTTTRTVTTEQQLDLHSRAIVTELSEDLATYCERLEGTKP